MFFPPFSSMYALSSICNSTYEDKKTVTGDCYDSEIRMLAKNIINSTNLARKVKKTEWLTEPTAD
jgi:hypothetical protein